MKQAIETLGSNLPRGFFIANDTLAIGALRALQEANITVPQRVSLISFNDTALTTQVYPTLSSITVFTEEMGRTAVDILNKARLYPSETERMTKLGTKLTLRESTI